MAAASVIPISWQETPIYSLQLLLEAGAKPELVDQNGKTALMFAKEAGNSVFVRLLEEAKNRD